MERSRRPNDGTGVDILEIVFDEKKCTCTTSPIIIDEREI